MSAAGIRELGRYYGVEARGAQDVGLSRTFEVAQSRMRRVLPEWVQNGYEGLSPWFGYRTRAKLKASLMLVGMVALPAFAQYFVIRAYTACFRTMETLLREDTVEVEALWNTLVWFVKVLVTYITCHVVGSGIQQHLGNKISVHMRGERQKSWIETGAYNGFNYIKEEKETLNPSNVISRDISQYVNSSLGLLVSLATALASTARAADVFYRAASWRMAYICFAVVCAVKFLTYLIGGRLKGLEFKTNSINDAWTRDSNSLNTYSESIELKGGRDYEKAKLGKHSVEYYGISSGRVILSMVLDYVGYLIGWGSYGVGIILCFNKLVSKEMLFADAEEVGMALGAVLQILAWQDRSISQVVSATSSYDRMNKLEAYKTKWSDAMAVRKAELAITRVECGMTFHGQVCLPDGREVFSDRRALVLKPGKAYLLEGPSGSGKSTLMKAIYSRLVDGEEEGVWPYASGELELPERVKMVPQKPYMEEGKTLAEVLMYPRQGSLTDNQKVEIAELMTAFGFKDDIVKHIYENHEGEPVTNWSRTLSGGEGQRAAVLSSIIAAILDGEGPKLLMLDESLSGVGHDMEKAVHGALKKILPEDATILYTDHRPQEGIADEVIDIRDYQW